MRLIILLSMILATHFIKAQSSNSYSLGSGFSYGNSQSNYVGNNVDGIKTTTDELQRRHDLNKKNYDDFILDKLTSLETDTSSLKYKSQIYALNNFTINTKYIVDSGNWVDAGGAIEDAKAQYYKDILAFLTHRD